MGLHLQNLAISVLRDFCAERRSSEGRSLVWNYRRTLLRGAGEEGPARALERVVGIRRRTLRRDHWRIATAVALFSAMMTWKECREVLETLPLDVMQRNECLLEILGLHSHSLLEPPRELAFLGLKEFGLTSVYNIVRKSGLCLQRS